MASDRSKPSIRGITAWPTGGLVGTQIGVRFALSTLRLPHKAEVPPRYHVPHFPHTTHVRDNYGDYARRDRYDPDDDITRKIKLEAPTFDGRLDPRVFTDWLSDMDQYFN